MTKGHCHFKFTIAGQPRKEIPFGVKRVVMHLAKHFAIATDELHELFFQECSM